MNIAEILNELTKTLTELLETSYIRLSLCHHDLNVQMEQTVSIDLKCICTGYSEGKFHYKIDFTINDLAFIFGYLTEGYKLKSAHFI